MKTRTPQKLVTNLAILNKDQTNINNAITNKVYARMQPNAGFSFETAEYVVVSSSNRIFQSSSAESAVIVEDKSKKAGEVAKTFLTNLYKQAGLKRVNAHNKGKPISHIKGLAKEYIEGLNVRAVSRVRPTLTQNVNVTKKSEMKTRFNINRICRVADINIAPAINHLRFQSSSNAPALETISKDLLKIRERLDQLQTDRTTEAAIAQFKQNYAIIVEQYEACKGELKASKEKCQRLKREIEEVRSTQKGQAEPEVLLLEAYHALNQEPEFASERSLRVLRKLKSHLLTKGSITDSPTESEGYAKISQQRKRRQESRNSEQKTLRSYQGNSNRDISPSSSKGSYAGFDSIRLLSEEEPRGYSAIMKMKKVLYTGNDNERNRGPNISTTYTDLKSKKRSFVL